MVTSCISSINKLGGIQDFGFERKTKCHSLIIGAGGIICYYSLYKFKIFYWNIWNKLKEYICSGSVANDDCSKRRTVTTVYTVVANCTVTVTHVSL